MAKRTVARIALLTLTICVIVGGLCLPAFAAVPTTSTNLGDGLYLIDSMNWSDVGNTAVAGDKSTYYQWFHTYIPIEKDNVYAYEKEPLFIYTYDGSYLDGQEPTHRYALMIYPVNAGVERPSLLVDYIRVDADGSKYLLSSKTYVYGTDYNDSIAFAGWGMTSNGDIYAAVELDGIYNAVRMAATPNGDKHLFAIPNDFNDLYILGCNTMRSGFTATTASDSFAMLKPYMADSSVFDDWLTYLSQYSPGTTANTHVIELYEPTDKIPVIDVGQLPSGGHYITHDWLYRKIQTVTVPPSLQRDAISESDDRCTYGVNVQQWQRVDATTMEITNKIRIKVALYDVDGVYVDDVINYEFTTKGAKNAVKGISLGEGGTLVRLNAVSDNTTPGGQYIRESYSELYVEYTAQYLKGTTLPLYIRNGTTTYVEHETLQDALYRDNQIIAEINDYINSLPGISQGEEGKLNSVNIPTHINNTSIVNSFYDVIFGLNGVNVLAMVAATYVCVKVVLR